MPSARLGTRCANGRLPDIVRLADGNAPRHQHDGHRHAAGVALSFMPKHSLFQAVRFTVWHGGRSHDVSTATNLAGWETDLYSPANARDSSLGSAPPPGVQAHRRDR